MKKLPLEQEYELIRKSKEGCQESLTALYQQFYPAMVKHSRKFQDCDEALSLINEEFMATVRKFQFRGTRFITFFTNNLQSVYRKYKRQSPMPDIPQEAGGHYFQDFRVDLQEIVGKMKQRLNPTEVKVCEMLAMGLDQIEIAKSLGVSKQRISQRVESIRTKTNDIYQRLVCDE